MNDNDELILVDLDDNEIGSINKMDAHVLGKLHRAFSVFIINDDKMLIQKRNINKYHSGGLWANACCSHPRKGEELKDAVPRRLKDELGIELTAKELFHFVYKTKFNDNLYEYELDHVFITTYDGEINFNHDEIEEVKWIKIDELKEDVVLHSENYASWFIIALPKLLEKIKGLD